ncbi:peptidoglycan DD-metalloendopeptidase family protein [Seonamhaeicola sediminis]|uniref:Peptidoglycan DD-metalloendopeptidase family protein n=1 Tax=Seonamhaeicola sediminis TaxID=2528206 RepID=A0A562YH71_9FLAO|nr:peptidoglycan DD-metalloendopeptidase family protein [Seonamhaeicola sediminis]TWO34410.1 peptidoglycan DD-metalloendopeptidase family protein [Seonamhaeicola sediminis]
MDNVFSEFLNSLSSDSLCVLDTSIPKSEYIPIDLSELNKNLSKIDVSSTLKLGQYIDNYIRKHSATVAYGGYLEVRNIYKRSQHFSRYIEEERNIHLGIDFWCQEGTPICSPLEGKIHSFKNNTNFGDYGPTLILEHNIGDVIFYSLYGHLSLNSIQGLKEGSTFEKGERIGELGDETVNGNYPPHLHFQIIKDLQANQGDYPGVCSKKDLDFYSENCPNPNLLLQL